jgi:GNAT superfamily N-acetyltransferase
MALFFGGIKTMGSEVKGINERLKRAGISLKDTLAVIDMTLEDQFSDLESISPYDVFEALNELTERTVHGTKIERFRPQKGNQPFHTFEIHTENGEALGYLNMIYFRKPIPCYYLVYVEVLISFRGRGLGHKIIKAFREFVEDRGAVGLLDNIIPPEEPTYDIYTKLGWKGIEGLIGNGMVNGKGHYMVFVPTSIKAPDLKDKLIKLLFNLRKKRSLIDMHDNESMVKRTIAEFRSVYGALESLFDTELSTGESTPLMRFMFTKFVTKVLGFQRRIGTLLGYTGGESLEQISISDRIKALPIQPCSLWGSKEGQAEMWGEEEIIRDLPEGLKREPTHYIEGLPLYRRPYLSSWMERKGGGRSLDLRISDLLELGFDPTKLREFRHEGVEYIFERISPRFLPSIEKQRRLLLKIAEYVSGMRFRNATIQINPPIAILRDRGNVYILRRKVNGIHSEEALDQLRISPYLKNMNREVEIDRAVVLTINEVREGLMEGFDARPREEIEKLAFFIPWEIEKNIPKVTVDISGISFDTMWIA